MATRSAHPTPTTPPLGTAVVVGGSIAGLAAAATLAQRAREVVLVERREAPESGSIAPQGRLPHVMLAEGSRVLEALFPGFAQELLDRGAETGGPDPTRLPCHWVAGGSTRTQLRLHDHGFPRALCSRTLVEDRLRARTLAHPRVRSVRASAEGLVVEEAPSATTTVTGVRLGGAPDLAADLVVDASGRNSHLAGSLPDGPPDAEVVVDLRYASYIVERRGEDLGGAAFAVVQNTRDIPRMGVALPMEGARWQIALGGYFGAAAPDDPDGAAAWAGSLGDAALVPLLRRPLLAEPARYTFRSSRRCHWDRLRRHPHHLCVLGDALASFNPIYGQGMTSALLQAEALGLALDEHRADPRLARTLARRLAAIVDNPWLTATGTDFVYPETQGRRPPGNGVVNRYVDRVTRAAAVDDLVNIAFSDVQQLAAAPPTLFRPRVAARALRYGGPARQR